MFVVVKITTNADTDKYSYSRYGIGFDSCSFFSISNSWDKYAFIFEVDNNSSVHTDNREKIIVLGEGSAQVLDDISVTFEAKYSISLTGSRKRFVLCLNYNGNDSFLC